MLSDIVESCQFLLNNYPDAEDSRIYLNSRISKETQETFNFGYFPPLKDLSTLISLVGQQTLLDSDLIIPSARGIVSSYFDNHQVILPFKDVYGEVIGLIGRTLLSAEDMKTQKVAKYKNTSEKHNAKFKKGNHLFGLFENQKQIVEHDSVFLVEGQFDVIKAYESGFRNIVALSNSNMTLYQFSLIIRYTNNIFLLLDNDEAGIAGRKRIMSMFGGLANIKNLYLPEEYKDIDEYLSKNTYESLSFIIKD